MTKQLEELRAMKAAVKAGKDVKVKSETTDKEAKLAEAHLFPKQPTAAQVGPRSPPHTHTHIVWPLAHWRTLHPVPD